MQTLRNLYKNSDFIQNSAKLITGTTISQILLFLASPILTRLYDAKDFGDLAIINSSVGIIVILATLRYEMGIVIADTDEEAESLRSQVNYSSLVLAGVLALGFTLLKYAGIVHSPWWYLLIPSGVYFQGLQFAYNYTFNRYKQYSELTISKIFQVGSNGLWAIIVGFTSSLKIGLLAAPIIGLFSSCLYLATKNKKKSKASGVSILKKYNEFPKLNLPSALIDTLSQHAPVYALTYLYSSELTGHYSLAMKVLLLPMALISTAISQVFFQKFSELYKERSKDCLVFIFKIWKTLFAIGFAPILVLYFFGEPLFKLVFGEQWAQAGNIVSTLAPMLLFMFISSPTSTVFITIKKQGYSLIFTIVVLIYRIGSLYYGYTQNNALIGFKLLAICEITQIFLYNLLLTHLVKKELS